MKVTYLVQKRQEDGTTRLETVSHNEWVGLIREKSGLPKAQRRFFIKECIQENGEIDCMYIEVPYEVYKQWNCEHMRSERNRKSMSGGRTGIPKLCRSRRRSSASSTNDTWREIPFAPSRSSWKPRTALLRLASLSG